MCNDWVGLSANDTKKKKTSADDIGDMMHRKDMKKLIDDIFEEVLRVRDAGQTEYARDRDNVFANFERVASFTGTTREKALLTYMIKHIDGICAYADGHRSQRENVRGRLTDIIVYCLLLWGMVEENDGYAEQES